MRAKEHEVFGFVLVNAPRVMREWDLAADSSHAQTPLLFWCILFAQCSSSVALFLQFCASHYAKIQQSLFLPHYSEAYGNAVVFCDPCAEQKLSF